ncbi:hypothetical protein [Pseudomonas sp.]|uniref:hypothetical protein n=1 Tax=Pseudomonas sp. TaxID=306 RepID=UPI002B97F1E0|nr:hypothetical protein [Pseudomonas sp.]HUE92230.1 hypothetical protein [Pseudomonas sp.]
MKERAKAVYGSALAYARAASALNAAARSDMSLLLPSMVNAALALELCLKALYEFETDMEFKVQGRYSHDFHALFKLLPNDTKSRINSHFANALASRDMRDIKVFENMQTVVSLNLERNLADWASIFTELRYAHQFVETHKDKQKTMLFFPEIMAAVSDSVSRPDRNWLS